MASASDRTFVRWYPTWGRTWRYAVPTALAAYQPPLAAAAAEARTYQFDFSEAPELQAGATIVSATITGGTGLTVGAPTVTTAAVDGVPAGQGVTATISGGSPGGQPYALACAATLSTGAVLVVPGYLLVVPNC